MTAEKVIIILCCFNWSTGLVCDNSGSPVNGSTGIAPSITALCVGKSCAFQVDVVTGDWQSYCLDFTVPNAFSCTASFNTNQLLCACTGTDRCNYPNTMLNNILTNPRPYKQMNLVNLELVMPSDLSVECYECGKVTLINNTIYTQQCDGTYMCAGSFCITEQINGSALKYCGNTWKLQSLLTTKLASPSCYNNATLCICSENDCNS